MDRIIYTSMTGASQTLERQAAIAHNLANVNTDGYKAEEHRLRAVEVQRHGEALKTALPVRAFTADATTHNDFSQGPMNFTGNKLDVAVRGTGWLTVQGNDGTQAYTRAGGFTVDTNGTLRTKTGLVVLADDNRPIAIPPDSKIDIGDDGVISAVDETGAQNASTLVARLKLINPGDTNLKRSTDGLFRMANGTLAPQNDSVRIVSGFIEGSNVNPSEQMVNMISTARQFEAQLKLITTAKENDQTATSIITQF